MIRFSSFESFSRPRAANCKDRLQRVECSEHVRNESEEALRRGE